MKKNKKIKIIFTTLVLMSLILIFSTNAFASTPYDCNPYQCNPHNCNPYQCNPHDCNCRWVWGAYICDTCYDTCYQTCYDICYQTCYTPDAFDVYETTNINTPVTITLNCTDPDTPSLTYIKVSDPSHGYVSPISGNQISYTPTVNYDGPDSFNYKCNDGNRDSNVATVHITMSGCTTDSDCDYLDDDYCTGTNITHDEGICVDSVCTTETTTTTECDDGLYCNGEETCSNARCVAGTDIDCSSYDLSPIQTCNNDPDNIPVTWDYYSGFTSQCIEATDSCSTSTISLTHTCDTTRCGAECEDDADCDDTDPLTIDECLNDCTCNHTTVGECTDDEDCDYLDDDYCDGTLIKHDEGVCIDNLCTTETITVQECNDSLYCNGYETCSNAQCVDGTDVDCSGYDISFIATCFNVPDANIYTFDFRGSFNSVCNEDTDACTTGDDSILHVCSTGLCGAECDSDGDCPDTECPPDGCVGNDWYDFEDVPNNCQTDCTCEENQCDNPTISYNDSRCTECQDDDDCNDRDRDYCVGTEVIHDEGVCIDFSCQTNTTTVEDCLDTLYCNGEETCSNGACVDGTAIDCTAHDMPLISTCYNSPDNNPFTYDHGEPFTSQCNETSDQCTTETQTLTHTCSDEICHAECEDDADCSETDCDYLDGCYGDDWHDFDDVDNACLGDCTCEENQCGSPADISYNDSRCTECQDDDDCDALDDDYCVGKNVTHDEGKCVDFQCTTQTTTTEACDDGLYCNGEETCLAAQCITGTAIDCSTHDLPLISTCYNNPDNNPFTYDHGEPFTSQCNETSDSCTSGAQSLTHTCSDEICHAECEDDHDCDPTPCGGECRGDDWYEFDDVANTCLGDCSCTENDCSSATYTISYNDSRCTECQTDNDCDHLDQYYCSGDNIVRDNGICVDFRCTTETLPVQDCDDGLYCNGNETCSNAQCIVGTAIDCTAFNIPFVATCFNNPDNNPFTFDYRSAYTSTCDEATDSCTAGPTTIQHICSESLCSAECDQNSDCSETDCDYLDGCYGDDYHDFDDVANDCLGDCTCESNSCLLPRISYNDSRCTECQDDDDCDARDRNYCSGDDIIHEEGFCVNFKCESRITDTTDCDDGAYCNGEESCLAAQCIAGTAIDCTAHDLPLISQCDYSPDNNPFTYDHFDGFTSTCDEVNDQCTTGTISLTHTCSKNICHAECEDNADCAATDCDYLDGCVGDDWHDYDDVANDCGSDCECDINTCAPQAARIIPNDPRCTECQTDDDCDILDNDYCSGTNVTHDEGRCVNYQCTTETTTTQECDDGLYCNGAESCLAAQCILGSAIDCTANDLPIISTCYNNPDNNPFTYDHADAFTSQCNETSDQCTVGTQSLTHVCSMNICFAECEDDHDCDATNCDHLDGCVGDDWYDYNEVDNTCEADCGCSDNDCSTSSYTISYNDARCTECQTDDDCDVLDNDYCIGDNVTHDEGRCVNFRCTTETTTTQACDNGEYCDGEESCLAAQCIPGTTVDCSANDLPLISTCDNDPDNNPFTYDHFDGFTSTCDEVNDQCTTGTTSLTHVCSINICGAECEDNIDCDATDCDHLDGCVGYDWYDYNEVNNTCNSTCGCSDNDCSTSNYTVSENDPRCTPCQTNDDCSDLTGYYCDGDIIKYDVGICSNYQCITQTTTIENCSLRDGLLNDCGLTDWTCEEKLTGIECAIDTISPDDTLCTDFCAGDYLSEGFCDTNTWNCAYTVTDCSLDDTSYCAGTEIASETYTCNNLACELDTNITSDCNDSLYCNGYETCSNAQCVAGTTVDCSGNNIQLISHCYNDPDNNPFTYDHRAAFTSTCNEDTDSCTTGDTAINHTCEMDLCGAECEDDHDCPDTVCADSCIGNDWYEYPDQPNACLGDCTCEENDCSGVVPIITVNHPSCLGCTVDENCSGLNSDVDTCDGTKVIAYEGVCQNYNCVNVTVIVEECDDGLYCNGTETCEAGACIKETQPIDCSGNDLSPIATCNNDPDNNPLTWDFFAGFTSICDEANDQCTTGTLITSHTCNTTCGAECVSAADCPEKCTSTSHKLYELIGCNNCSCEYGSYSCVVGSCGAECDEDTDCNCPDDYCDGTTLYDYPDNGECGTSGSDGCLCLNGTSETEPCEPDIIPDSIDICGCITNDDCDPLDNDYCNGSLIMHDEGICVNDSCTINTSTVQECLDELYCNGAETCENASCVAGTAINCTPYDIIEVDTCTWDPDNNPFTFDFRDLFISTCNETTDSCETGNETITHTCDMETCEAECVTDFNCTGVCPHDICVEELFYDYPENGTCAGNCSCVCEPVIGTVDLNTTRISFRSDNGTLINIGIDTIFDYTDTDLSGWITNTIYESAVDGVLSLEVSSETNESKRVIFNVRLEIDDGFLGCLEINGTLTGRGTYYKEGIGRQSVDCVAEFTLDRVNNLIDIEGVCDGMTFKIEDINNIRYV